VIVGLLGDLSDYIAEPSAVVGRVDAAGGPAPNTVSYCYKVLRNSGSVFASFVAFLIVRVKEHTCVENVDLEWRFHLSLYITCQNRL